MDYFGDKYSVYAIDLAGHGESGLERTEWTIENYGKDVAAVIEKEKLNNVILIGHSMGGPVVLSAAHLMSDKVKAIIAVDTFQDIEGRWTDEQFERFFKPFEEDFENTTKGFVKSIFGENADSNLVETIANDMSSAPPEVALSSFRNLFEFEEAPVFDKINPPNGQASIPVRFINSKRFPTNTGSAKKHIKDFELKIIEGVGHFPMLESPEEFNRILEGTINELE
jgi:pimeloyl-ACP methyl ester carboxylesterase